MSQKSILSVTSKNILLGLGAALLIASCTQNEHRKPVVNADQPHATITQPETTQPKTEATKQNRFLGLFSADITTNGQTITSAQIRPLSTASDNTALENIVFTFTVDSTTNLSDVKAGAQHYLTTLNVTNKSAKNIAVPTFVPLATTRT